MTRRNSLVCAVSTACIGDGARVFPIHDRGVVHVDRREIDQMLNRIHKITKHGMSPRVFFIDHKGWPPLRSA